MNFLAKIFVLVFILSFFIFQIPVQAQDHVVEVYFFYGEGCPHCAKEEMLLDKLEQELDYIHIHRHEVWHDKNAQEILSQLARASGISTSAVPMTIVGNQVVNGYESEETTGEEIRHLIEICHIDRCEDQVAMIVGGPPDHEGLETAVEAPGTANPEAGMGQEEPWLVGGVVPEKINVPLFGEVNLKDFSLPVLTLIIAVLDGFNPCAMWVLVFLISLLLGVPSMRRRWILGMVFIAASGFVYFLFLSAWLNIFLFLGFLFWVRILIGVVAMGAGIYYLREFWTNRDGVCKVTSSPTRRKIMEYLKEVALGKKLLIALGGIILIAFAVNLIELVCSAGLPAIYTGILSLSNLPAWQYYLYLAGYIFVFMFDDMVVFVAAMLTLQMAGLNAKYSRYSNLIGGIIILILGILLIFKPGLLMFGG
ncbi:hypothetical protein KJ969_04680 [Patescibacteria group bacterium]|nr:hypothetical protein [Patescibacteria group bacterium]MBU1922309.1 hypothetical protein [Patescibacteria group bacterium]